MDFVDPSMRAVYETLDLIGVVLYGIIGGTIARARNFDLVGIAFLAIITALGGGMLRDVLIDNGPPAAVQNTRYFAMALLGALISMVIHMGSRTWEIFRVHGDAIVLGAWAVTGSTKALANDLPWSTALFLGVITAIGGGMIRDTMTGQVPSVFGGSTLYATPAAAAALIMVGVNHLSDSEIFGDFPVAPVGMVVSTLAGAGIVILSYWRGWVLPGLEDSSAIARARLRQPIDLARAMRRRGRRLAQARDGKRRAQDGRADTEDSGNTAS